MLVRRGDQSRERNAVDVSGSGGETAVLVEGSHSTVSAENTRIFMIFGGGGDDAVRATTGGVATLEEAPSASRGLAAARKGLVADGAAGAVVATGTAITISGAGGDIGASAVNGGSIILDGGTVSLPGAGGGEIGLRASGAGSNLTASGASVTIPNSGSGVGAHALAGGAITLGVGTNIQMGGSSAIGAQAGGKPARRLRRQAQAYRHPRRLVSRRVACGARRINQLRRRRRQNLGRRKFRVSLPSAGGRDQHPRGQPARP